MPLYQIQNGKPKLIAYSSKRLPGAARNYSITELEMCGLAINIASFAHLLRKVDFDAVLDHFAITQIMRSKVKPATNRIKRLLEVLSAYYFNLYYIKGKDMVLSDFLSRQDPGDEDTKEIIPISFNMRSIVQDKYYNIDENMDKYMVQTRSQMKASGVELPEVHGSSAMACFRLLHSGYDAEVIILVYDMENDTTLFLLLLVDIVLCYLNFDSHLLLYLIITLLLINYSYPLYSLYSLTHNKSLF